ncbi:envelope stress response membrane protein PspC [Bowmanella yangjiangensis]|uniref:Envelope stress response membrane protein PspC n=1 Tax=Bowmanella yangjiangensis TaxID=2811230 RepID=A0ABS3CXN9_9ALTE|nr:envelope stress response membrane protein PspC [Bowmanella yangjiangensis]MBN7820876.1 envelope stress response membrane protein PspC [Bowmanella yangjiangensis]
MKTKGEMFRNSQKGKVAGVCAGIADYFGWEAWLIRIILVSAVLLSGPFFIMAYIAAWFILDKKPVTEASVNQQGKGWYSGEEDNSHVEVKSKVWQAGEPPRQAFKDIKGRFDRLEMRLRKMETYVTSSEYQLNREISRL